MKMPEVCDENMTLPKGLEPSILSTLKLQLNFKQDSFEISYLNGKL